MFKTLNVPVRDKPGQHHNTLMYIILHTVINIHILLQRCPPRLLKRLSTQEQAVQITFLPTKFVIIKTIMVYFLHMSMKLTQSQTQKQIFAPSMQQSIEVLLLPIIDLEMTIEQELQNNPLLELSEPTPDADDHSSEQESFSKTLENLTELPNHYQDDGSSDDHTPNERQFRKEEDLEDHLLRQVRVDFNDPLDIAIGELIIGNIDEDGYLTITLEEIAQKLALTDTIRIEHVLKEIQSFEPLGVASRNLQECLLAQVNVKLNGNARIATRIINECLTELSQKKFQEIARKLKISLEDVKATVMQIALLDPKPARNYRPTNPNIYIKPDVVITHDEQLGYQIHTNKEGIPHLRINSFYKNLLKQKKLTKEEKTYVRERLQSALLFIKSIEQRGQTVRNIAQFILDKQQAFFEHGHSALVPMNLKDVASALDRNESTISRAVSNKYMDTPQGLLPMKYFFSQAVNDGAGEGQSHVSNRSLKEDIKELIKNENKTSPLSDQDIQNYLKEKGLTVARRTITKYRKMERILPSHLRKQ